MGLKQQNLINYVGQLTQHQRLIKIGNSFIPIDISIGNQTEAYVAINVSGTMMAQKLRFDETSAILIGDPEPLDGVKIFNTSLPEPSGSSSNSNSSNSMNFYKCASVINLQNDAIVTCAKNGNYDGWSTVGTITTEITDNITAIKLTGNSYLYKDISSLPQGSSPRSLSVWVKADTYTNDWMGVFGYGTDTSLQRFSLDIGTNGIPNVGLSWDSVNTSNSIVGDWHHLCVVYESNIIKIYIDGNLINSDTRNLDTQGTTLYVGYGVNNQTTYRGYIANCRAYAKALSQTQIKGLYQEFTSGLPKTWTGYKAYLSGNIYTFQENITSGLTYSNTKPISGNIYNNNALIKAILYQGLQAPSDNLAFYASLSENRLTAETGQEFLNISNIVEYTQKFGIPCAKFSGGNMLSISSNNIAFGDSPNSICLWVYLDNLPNNWSAFLDYGDYPQRTIGTTSDNVFKSGLNGNDCIGFTAPTTGKWYFIASTYAGGSYGEVKNYVNGICEKTIQTTFNVPSGNIVIGNDKNITLYIAGVRIYNKELSQEEINILKSEFTPDN